MGETIRHSGQSIWRWAIFLNAWLLFGVAWTQPISADIIVDIDGTGDFTSIQEAINAAPSNSDITTIIYIKRGTYETQKLIVPADKRNITLVGESREETIIRYDIHNCNDGGDGLCPDDKVALYSGEILQTAATLTILASDFRAENLTIENSAGPVGQAQAITVRGDRTIFINCDIKGYQDTIYLWASSNNYRTYFENCLVVGRTDYIYGNGIGYFNECEIRSWGGGWITAPSTPESQDYGFVFYNCEVTYGTNSPRSGDDGALVRFGRPWHEFPKVAWLYCEMTEKIHPEGWGDKWNMSYSDTDTRLHLYEYQNTGPGADMSGRASWAGLRALTAEEADDYEPSVALAGSDNWDPTAIPPTVTVYDWVDGGANNSWLTAANWNPVGVPAMGEAAIVDSVFVIAADGGIFEADLTMTNEAGLEVSAASTVTLLSIGGARITAAGATSLSGTIRTKDTVYLDVDGTLEVNAQIIGVHEVIKEGSGEVQLASDNNGFAGQWIVSEGDLVFAAENSGGTAEKIAVQSGGNISITATDAIFPTTALYMDAGATISLTADVTISEWYLGGILQPLGEYDATTHAGVISGTGKLIIGRPSVFNFVGGSNGNWDVAAHFSPALLPETGETVIVEREIEAQSSPFQAHMIVQGGGRIRLRSQASVCLGTITMHQGTQISYATSGGGFTLDAPIVLAGDITLAMNSGNANGSIMNLPGTFGGDHTIRITNTRTGSTGSATVDLGGDNSDFTGLWDLNTASATAGAITAINGLVANAFGRAAIEAAADNQVVFSHAKCAGDTLDMSLSGSAKAVLNTDVVVKKFVLNGEELALGTYNSTTHPTFLTGSGSINVGSFAALTITIAGSGTVEYDDSYMVGEEVTLTAVPEEGWEFAGWSGDQVSEEATLVFTIGEDTELTATFEETTLGVEKTPLQQVYVWENHLYTRGVEEVWVYSMSGKIRRVERNAVTDLNQWSKGVYLVKYQLDDRVYDTKIIVR